MIESISEYDDAIMEAYLEGEEISVKDIKAALRKAVLDVKIIPVTCGTSYRNKGVQKLLDASWTICPLPWTFRPSRA